MWLLLKPFLPYIIGIVALVGLTGMIYVWDSNRLQAKYDSGFSAAMAEINKKKEVAEVQQGAIISENVGALEQEQSKSESKYRYIDREIIKYVETVKETSCSSQFVDVSKPFDPEYIRVFNLGTSGNTGTAEVRPAPVEEVRGDSSGDSIGGNPN